MKKLYLKLFYLLNLILYFTVVALWISIPDEIVLNISTTLSALILTMILIVVDHERFKGVYTSTLFLLLVKRGTSFVLIFFILALLNYLAFKHPFQIDLTADKRNSITDQSQSIIKKMDGPLQVHIFGRKSELESVASLFELYRFFKSDLEIKKNDIELNPTLAKELGITESPSALITYKDRKRTIVVKDELAITNAFIKLLKPSMPTIYFTTGHGEVNLFSKEKDGASELLAQLLGSGFDVKELELLKTGSIPADADSVLVFGPTSRFEEKIVGEFKRYLSSGKNILFAFDLELKKNGDATETQAPLFLWLKEFGILPTKGLVVDDSSNVNGSMGTVPLVKVFDKEHPITATFNSSTFFPIARAIRVVKPSDEKGSMRFLAMSSDKEGSYAEMSINEIVSQKMSYHDGVDIPGPFPLALIWEGNKESKLGKFALLSTSGLVHNSYSFFPGNNIFVHNIISYLSDLDELISFNLPGKERVPVHVSRPQLGIILYFSVIFLPLILILTAIYLFYRRRGL